MKLDTYTITIKVPTSTGKLETDLSYMIDEIIQKNNLPVIGSVQIKRETEK